MDDDLARLERRLARERAARRQAEELAEGATREMYRKVQELEAVLETADDAFVSIDAESIIQEWNRAAEETFGWTREEAVGRSLAETIVPDRHLEEHLRGVANFVATGSGAIIGRRLEISGRRKDGSEVPVEVTPWIVGSGEHLRCNAFVRDITQRKEYENQLRQQALHDRLTALPNRALMLDRLIHALARSRRDGSVTAVLFIDLDRFKVVNDTMGHDAGDQLLLAVAARLQDAVRPGDTVARLGGDEFVVVCEGMRHRREAQVVAGRIVTGLENRFVLSGTDTFISGSVGVAFSQPGQDPEELLGDADLAMYRAKERGKGVFALFDDSMRTRLVERLATESALRAGLERNELRAVYQPITRLVDDEWTGVEALARWDHPEQGIIPPTDFIPLAEETGLIGAVGEWMLAAAAGQLLEWRARYGDDAPLTMAVNVSVRQLERRGFAESVRELITGLGLGTDRLVLEVTESALMRDEDTMVRTLFELRELGIRLALDDFGTAYSSLGRLSQLPVETLKLDRTLVRDLGTTGRGRALVDAAIAMAHSLGLGVVAEGVETDEQLAVLKELGCDEAQGFRIAPPMTASELDTRFDARRAQPRKPTLTK